MTDSDAATRERRDEEERLAAFRVALMLANHRADCFCGARKGHSGWIGCVEKEADRGIA